MQNFEFPIPDKAVDNPGLWYSNDLTDSQRQTILEPRLVDELLEATAQLNKDQLSAPGFSHESFATKTTRDFFRTLLEQLENGVGFAVIREHSFADLSPDDKENLFWGIGLHLGQAVPINADGELLGHVRDYGYDITSPHVRNYQTTEELIPHNDSCDILGLMCVQNARSGGHSAIASAIAIHHKIQRTRPEFLKQLYQPLPIDRRGERGWQEEGSSPWYALPVFSYFEGKISARYTIQEYYYQSQKFTDAPRINRIQKEALEYLKETASNPRFHISFQLAPGDIQLVNNYCVFHARTDYQDYPEPERKRHLLRLWLSVPNSRPLHPVFTKRFRSAKAGALRGGIAPRNI